MSKQKLDRSEDLYAGTLFDTSQSNTSSLEEVESSIKNNPEVKKLLAVIYPENKEEVENSIRISIELAKIPDSESITARFLDDLVSNLQGLIQLQIEFQLKVIRSILDDISSQNLRITDPTVLLVSLQMAQELFMMKEGGVMIKPSRQLFEDRYNDISMQEVLASNAETLRPLNIRIKDEIPRNFKIVSRALGINLVEKTTQSYQRGYKDEDDVEPESWMMSINLFKSPINNRFLVECFKFFDIELPEM